jgi:hypothetical protein
MGHMFFLTLKLGYMKSEIEVLENKVMRIFEPERVELIEQRKLQHMVWNIILCTIYLVLL